MLIGLVLFPRFTQLDATGPFEVFARIPDATVHLVAAGLEAVASDKGLRVLPTVTLDDCPQLDVLCVPGGPGQIDQMANEAVLGFLRRQAEGARYVTSVCTGSLLLGAAGLLRGYQATTHWAVHEDLVLFGAAPVKARLVRDRNRITGGGVTAGIDFALTVVSEIAGPEVAQRIQLSLEYDPDPPFDSGSPDKAQPAVVEAVRAANASRGARRHQANIDAATRLRER